MKKIATYAYITTTSICLAATSSFAQTQGVDLNKQAQMAVTWAQVGNPKTINQLAYRKDNETAAAAFYNVQDFVTAEKTIKIDADKTSVPRFGKSVHWATYNWGNMKITVSNACQNKTFSTTNGNTITGVEVIENMAKQLQTTTKDLRYIPRVKLNHDQQGNLQWPEADQVEVPAKSDFVGLLYVSDRVEIDQISPEINILRGAMSARTMAANNDEYSFDLFGTTHEQSTHTPVEIEYRSYTKVKPSLGNIAFRGDAEPNKHAISFILLDDDAIDARDQETTVIDVQNNDPICWGSSQLINSASHITWRKSAMGQRDQIPASTTGESIASTLSNIARTDGVQAADPNRQKISQDTQTIKQLEGALLQMQKKANKLEQMLSIFEGKIKSGELVDGLQLQRAELEAKRLQNELDQMTFDRDRQRDEKQQLQDQLNRLVASLGAKQFHSMQDKSDANIDDMLKDNTEIIKRRNAVKKAGDNVKKWGDKIETLEVKKALSSDHEDILDYIKKTNELKKKLQKAQQDLQYKQENLEAYKKLLQDKLQDIN